jgi:hypothetical protein
MGPRGPWLLRSESRSARKQAAPVPGGAKEQEPPTLVVDRSPDQTLRPQQPLRRGGGWLAAADQHGHC